MSKRQASPLHPAQPDYTIHPLLFRLSHLDDAACSEGSGGREVSGLLGIILYTPNQTTLFPPVNYRTEEEYLDIWYRDIVRCKY